MDFKIKCSRRLTLIKTQIIADEHKQLKYYKLSGNQRNFLHLSARNKNK